MQNNNNSKFKLALYGCVFAIAVLFFVFSVMKCKNDSSSSPEMVLLEPAPHSQLYRDYYDSGTRKTYKAKDGTKTEYWVDENGNVHMVKDGQEYVITKDGTVWKVNSDGTTSKVSGTEAAKVLTTLRNISNEDPNVSNAIKSSTAEEKTRLEDLTDSQIEEIAKQLGVDAGWLGEQIDEIKKGNPDATLADLLSKFQNQKEREKSEEETAYDWLRDYLKSLGFSDDEIEKIYGKIKDSPMGVADFVNDALHNGVNSALNAIGYSVAPVSDSAIFNAASGGIITDESGNKWKVNPDGTRTLVEDAGKDDYDKIIDALAGGESPDFSYLKDVGKTESNYIQQNGQSQKKSFVQSYQNGTEILNARAKSNMITTGTIINAILQTGINTDLPSATTVAIVTENVYDSFTHSNILIPKGSKLIASYDSSVTWGQSRVLIVWIQLIRTDGVIVQLNGYNGTDSLGYTGVGGSVNNHIGSIVGSAALSTLINIGTGAAASAGSGVTDKTMRDLINTMTAGTAESIQTIAANFLDKAVNRQPTIVIPNGTRMTIIANDNVELPIYRREKGVTWK